MKRFTVIIHEIVAPRRWVQSVINGESTEDSIVEHKSIVLAETPKMALDIMEEAWSRRDWISLTSQESNVKRINMTLWNKLLKEETM